MPQGDNSRMYLELIEEFAETFGRIASMYKDDKPYTFMKFNALTNVMFQLILDRIAASEGLSGSEELGLKSVNIINMHITAALNANLALNHPFVVALIKTNDEGPRKPGTVLRTSIPGIHDNLTARLVIFLRYFSGNNDIPGHFERVKIDYIGDSKSAPKELFGDSLGSAPE